MKYSPETISQLAEKYRQTDLARPMRVVRYEPGTELRYDITGVAVANPARMRVRIERFVGGGFAGQVYRVKLLSLDAPNGDIPGLTVGDSYAVKILIPPAKGAQAFRDMIYAVGFQAPFSLQVNPAAARSGALWQTLIRRAAKMRFGTDRAVTAIHATFVDSTLGSCGEISEWIDGRTWRLEVDDHLGGRRRWKVGESREGLNSPEFLTKRQFMADIVTLLHDMGAPELARQYEWWTCKSQPNCLKRTDSGDDPETGLTAVDFRAGLALLPFLPMSPRDFPLIFKGLARGSLVQFDRGSLTKLHRFIDDHREHFADMKDVLAELAQAEDIYRNSMPDITHNHLRLLYSPKLWSTMLTSAVDSWRVRGVTDRSATLKLRDSRVLTLLFGLLGMLTPLAGVAGLAMIVMSVMSAFNMGPVAAAPIPCRWAFGGLGALLLIFRRIPGRFAQCFLGKARLRRHYGSMLTSWSYFKRAVRGHILERLIDWHRDRRLDNSHVDAVVKNPWLYLLHKPLSILPPGVHRFVSDSRYFRSVFKYIFLRPIKLYFDAGYRKQWMLDMLQEGRKKHLITEADANEIEGQLDDPYIEKYLKSLAVHVCTLPISQVVAVIWAIYYSITHGHSLVEFGATVGVCIAAVQVMPISPGSLARGLYVTYMVIRERDLKNYNVALPLSFLKYIGYLAFPIQMTYRYPTLARFMAGHWATGAVTIVPVFGEKGALLEHAAFDLFYNYPLTIRRRLPLRNMQRTHKPPRFWHAVPLTLAGLAALFAVDWWFFTSKGYAPSMRNLWYVALIVTVLVGRYIVKWAGGARTRHRLLLAIIAGITIGLVHGVTHTAWKLLDSGAAASWADMPAAMLVKENFNQLATRCFAYVSALGALVLSGAVGAELLFREPKKPYPSTPPDSP